MMKFFLVLVILIGGAMAWQHLRYFSVRRDVVQDRQPILHSPSRFHVVMYLAVSEDDDLIEEVSRLRSELEAQGNVQVVYAGQAAFTQESTQLGAQSWDAVVLVQYPSRESYEALAKSERYRDALAAFPQTYSHGMQRNPVVNLLIPQLLLALRTYDVVTGNGKVEEFEPMPLPDDPERVRFFQSRMQSLLELKSVNDKALVIFNLTKPGTPEEQKANASYGRQMLGRMAALAHGPMHLGTAQTLEGEASFEEVVIVYYPGVEYFSRLAGSRFFSGIFGDKQLSDTLVVATVPILSQL